MDEQDNIRMDVRGGFIEGPRELLEFLMLLERPFEWLRNHGFELREREDVPQPKRLEA